MFLVTASSSGSSSYDVCKAGSKVMKYKSAKCPGNEAGWGGGGGWVKQDFHPREQGLCPV